MSVFVYGPVTSETLPKMGMQAGLISATATAAKGHGSKDTLASLVMKAKSAPERYATIAASKLSSVPGWQTTYPKPSEEKSVRRTTSRLWLKRMRQGSESIASLMSSIEH